jgi:transcriptional regulator EpsA
MTFLPTLAPAELHHYHQVVTRSVDIRSHLELLKWLQGDMQRYLPHDILVATWGNFEQGHLRHDVISTLDGVRSHDSDNQAITPLMRALHARWTEFGKRPFSLNARQTGFLLGDSGLENTAGDALQTMRSAIVHGIVDERGSHHCIYVGFSKRDSFSSVERSAMAVVLPYIDTALRQVSHLPHQNNHRRRLADSIEPVVEPDYNMTDRESEVLRWVARGKTNPEIAMILEISAFTVKNHMQRVFKKLDVTNRAQAVSKYRPSGASDVQV